MMKRFQLFLPSDLLKRLRKLAKPKGESVATLVRLAVVQYLERNETKPQESK